MVTFTKKFITSFIDCSGDFPDLIQDQKLKKDFVIFKKSSIKWRNQIH